MSNGLGLNNGGNQRNKYGDNRAEYQDGLRNIEI